jgi:hypothetical protein
LAHLEHAERADEEGNDQPCIGILHPQAGGDHVQRDHDRFEGNHHRGHDHHEDEIAPTEVELRDA